MPPSRTKWFLFSVAALMGLLDKFGSKYRFFLLAKNYLKGLVVQMSKDYEPATKGTLENREVCLYHKYSRVVICRNFEAVFLGFQFFQN